MREENLHAGGGLETMNFVGMALSSPNFSPSGVHIHVLWRILQSVRNEEKNKEIKTKFRGAIINFV